MTSSPGPQLRLRRLPALISACVIALAGLAAWYNSLSTPFFFDDEAVVLRNPTIRHLWPLWTALSPPDTGGGSGVTARPVINLSLAVNYALGGLDVRGYHLLNVIVHILAALALFGVVRWTFAFGPSATSPPGRNRFAFADGDWAAFAVALLWLLHPLQTEPVTCVVQRTESIMGLFYLVTLYCFIGAAAGAGPAIDTETAGRKGPVVSGQWSRGSGLNRSSAWSVLAVLACLAGMASKEVMVTAPLVALLYDRTFVAGTFREAWRRRRPLYLALASTWILLAWLVLSSGGQRAGSVGFGLGASVWNYLLTQCRALLLYLKLSLWPHPLVIDYGMGLVHSLAAVWWQAIVVVTLLGLTAWSLVKKPRLGFLGAWFFLILAPSSSVLPLVTQTIAEHRMYLALAAPVALGVTALYRWTGRRGLLACFVLAPALGWLTISRNHDYRTTTSIWRDAVAKDPTNPRAHGNLGDALLAARHYREAVGQFRAALRLKPDYNQIYNNLGDALLHLHRPREAIAAFAQALRLFPLDPDVHNNLGNAFLQLGRTDDAVREYEISLRVSPNSPDTEFNLANALMAAGRIDEAIRHFQAALRLAPHRAATHYGLAAAYVRAGDAAGAEREFNETLRLAPNDAEAGFALGNVYAQTGRYDAAIAAYRQVLKFRPDFIQARNNLGNVYLMTGHLDRAIDTYEEILRRQPENASARRNLDQARALQRGRAR